MPRKNEGSLEERMHRARGLAEYKEQREKKFLKGLYASPLYRYTRKSCIAFLWISQLMLIDWALPYLEERDKIANGYFNANTITTQTVGGISDLKLSELYIKTHGGRSFNVDFEGHEIEPGIGDSIILYKSMIFHDLKKIKAPRINESYFVSSSVTYRAVPFIVIISGMALAFIFIKNIEVKGFAWFTLICTAGFGLYLVTFMAMTFF